MCCGHERLGGTHAGVERRIASAEPTGAVYLIDPTHCREFQTIRLRTTDCGAPLDWRVNDTASASIVVK